MRMVFKKTEEEEEEEEYDDGKAALEEEADTEQFSLRFIVLFVKNQHPKVVNTRCWFVPVSLRQ